MSEAAHHPYAAFRSRDFGLYMLGSTCAYMGQAMIATGVVTTLATWRADYALHHRL